LLAAIPGARSITYKGAGHAFHWEDPPAFAADLMAFFSECSALGALAVRA
jgi:non-heme chloroperoxidase